MCKLNPYKATGQDGINPYVLKNVSSLSHSLALLFRHSMDSGKLPEDWKTANICALYKKGSKQLPNNYRPVSLTSQVAKLTQPTQSSGKAYKAYTDFQKAFDFVPHRRLLHTSKLSMYGVKGKILRWLTSFLVDRRQRVVLEGARSPWCNVTSGVPQGTIMGLFDVNDLPERRKPWHPHPNFLQMTAKFTVKFVIRLTVRSFRMILIHWQHGHETGYFASARSMHRSVYKDPITLSIFYRGPIPEAWR